MGTNYYLHEASEHAAELAVAADWCRDHEMYFSEMTLRDAIYGSQELHIGKSSAGWCFSLHVIPEENINTLDDWKERWSRPGAIIKNEYGEVVTPEKMLSTITERKWDRPTVHTAAYLQSNHASEGPNGLLRHEYHSTHGEGTWDYVTGEFS